MRFRDREHAGELLAQALEKYEPLVDGLVLALPRGGVPIGRVIADALGLPLDVLLVRKLGTPQQPELAMGAIASGGARYINQDVVRMAGISAATLERVAAAEQDELERRERVFRGDRPPLRITGRSLLLVDDGVATGSTMIAAVRALRALRPLRIVVTVPVAPRATLERLRQIADDCICLHVPGDFLAIGQFYDHFDQLTDAQVVALLNRQKISTR